MIDLGTIIRGSRTFHHDQLPTTDDERHRWIAAFCEMATASGQQLQIVILRSLQKSSVLFPLSTGSVLIIDEQIFAMLRSLTKILFWAGNKNAAFSYFGKLLGEEALLAGNPALAQLGYTDFQTLSPFWKPQNNFRVTEALKNFYLQEMFIMAHEISHALALGNSSIAAIIRESGDLLTSDGRARERLEEAHTLFMTDFPGRISLEDFCAQSDAREDFVVRNRKALHDEVSCDNFALVMLLSNCEGSGTPFGEAFKAGLLCLKHLRLLSYIRTFARQMCGVWSAAGADQRGKLIEAREGRLASSAQIHAMRDNSINHRDEQRQNQLLSDQHAIHLELPLLQEYLPRIEQLVNSNRLRFQQANGDHKGCIAMAEKNGWRSQIGTRDFILF